VLVELLAPLTGWRSRAARLFVQFNVFLAVTSRLDLCSRSASPASH
jgi:hypothetical protein